MSMILLEPANTILYNSIEDQAADHLINGVFGNNRAILAENATLREVQSQLPESRFYVHLPKDRSESVNECIGLMATSDNTFR